MWSQRLKRLQREQQAIDALERSIKDLYEALAALGWQPPADEPVQE